jgi:hypothetical protein
MVKDSPKYTMVNGPSCLMLNARNRDPSLCFIRSELLVEICSDSTAAPIVVAEPAHSTITLVHSTITLVRYPQSIKTTEDTDLCFAEPAWWLVIVCLCASLFLWNQRLVQQGLVAFTTETNLCQLLNSARACVCVLAFPNPRS